MGRSYAVNVCALICVGRREGVGRMEGAYALGPPERFDCRRRCIFAINSGESLWNILSSCVNWCIQIRGGEGGEGVSRE